MRKDFEFQKCLTAIFDDDDVDNFEFTLIESMVDWFLGRHHGYVCKFNNVYVYTMFYDGFMF